MSRDRKCGEGKTGKHRECRAGERETETVSRDRKGAEEKTLKGRGKRKAERVQRQEATRAWGRERRKQCPETGREEEETETRGNRKIGRDSVQRKGGWRKRKGVGTKGREAIFFKSSNRTAAG